MCMVRISLAIFAVVCSVASASSAQQTAAEPTAPLASEFARTVQRALREYYQTGDGLDRAIGTLRQAVQIEPSNPEALGLIAEIQEARGALADSVESYRVAGRVAVAAGDARWQARGLFGAARLLERQAGRIAEARAAWIEYGRFAESHRDVAWPELARARVSALDVVIEMEEVYSDVRRRIAARERGAAR